jgi:hypothetical protein
MKTPVLLCSLFVAICYMGGQRQAIDPCAALKTDPYSLNDVRTQLQLGRFTDVSFVTKHIGWLGDGVSVAVLKIVGPEKLREPETCLDYLSMVRTAFEAPKIISIEANRDPKVTLFVLHYLEEKIQDKELSHKILDTETFVKTQTNYEAVRPDLFTH